MSRKSRRTQWCNDACGFCGHCTWIDFYRNEFYKLINAFSPVNTDIADDLDRAAVRMFKKGLGPSLIYYFGRCTYTKMNGFEKPTIEEIETVKSYQKASFRNDLLQAVKTNGLPLVLRNVTYRQVRLFRANALNQEGITTRALKNDGEDSFNLFFLPIRK